jgi:hypothetical protein
MLPDLELGATCLPTMEEPSGLALQWHHSPIFVELPLTPTEDKRQQGAIPKIPPGGDKAVGMACEP